MGNMHSLTPVTKTTDIFVPFSGPGPEQTWRPWDSKPSSDHRGPTVKLGQDTSAETANSRRGKRGVLPALAVGALQGPPRDSHTQRPLRPLEKGGRS